MAATTAAAIASRGDGGLVAEERRPVPAQQLAEACMRKGEDETAYMARLSRETQERLRRVWSRGCAWRRRGSESDEDGAEWRPREAKSSYCFGVCSGTAPGDFSLHTVRFMEQLVYGRAIARAGGDQDSGGIAPRYAADAFVK